VRLRATRGRGSDGWGAIQTFLLLSMVHVDVSDLGAGDAKPDQLVISSDHFSTFISVLTTFAPELSDFCGQNR
jgi:hypothetical protein